MIGKLAGLTSSTVKMATLGKKASFLAGKSLFPTQERLTMMQETGSYLRDLRELAGLTLNDLNETLEMSDQSLLEAVENGTATLSFELVLRLAALLARHDPIPFVIRFVRTYNPEIWAILEDWGIAKIPIQLERERQFLNIYRSRDEARQLKDEEFAHVLQFTKSAFEMALHFAEKGGLVVSQEKQEET